MINAGYSVESPWPICYSGQRRGDLIFRHLSDLLGPLCQGGRGGSPGALHQPSSRNTAEVAIKLFYNRAYSLDYEYFILSVQNYYRIR